MRPAYVSKLAQAASIQPYDAGDSTYCILTANQAQFKTFRGNPVNGRYTSASNFPNNPTYVYDPAPIEGLRYFIFGVPL